MPTLTLPIMAALLIAVVQLTLSLILSWGRPQATAQKLRSWRGFTLLLACLFGWLLLLDYSEWKEGYATRGYQRRVLLLGDYGSFVEQQLSMEAHGSDHEGCLQRLELTHQRYEELSKHLQDSDGTALPAVNINAEVDALTACQQLEEFLRRSRLVVLENELNHDFDRGVGTYFADRLFDSE
ncbi:MAG: hypothetical protein GY879_10985 [Planctomycetes bacterium]|nr:hypothetical protein [Planctomycetota bacterium]